MLTYLHRFLFHVKNPMRDAMEVMLELPMNGFITITLLIKLVHHIKLLAMTTVLDALLKLNVRTVFQEEVAGLKKELKSMGLINMEMSKENKI